MGKKLKNNIVIVCEGTETEAPYLEELKTIVNALQPERFSDIKIIPTSEDLKECVKRNKNIKKRNLKGSGKARYYTQEEERQEDYERYKMQPTRYVREAQLYLSDNSYTEAWAVYDFDDFPDHENARALADSDPRLHIAFSSVSIEEWFLLHFELNSTAFQKSVCKENGKDIMCGTGAHTKDCNGTVCAGGRLRSLKYLSGYDKNGEGLFKSLEPRLEHARIGAAWTRGLNPSAKIWLQNPYTDFDCLVNRLLGYSKEYKWAEPGTAFSTTNTDISVNKGILANVGKGLFVCEVTLHDGDFNKINSSIVRLEAGEEYSFDNGDYISFPNGKVIVFVQLHS